MRTSLKYIQVDRNIAGRYYQERAIKAVCLSLIHIFSNKCSPIERISIQSGGDALNNAVDLAKLGNQVCYMGRIGTDVGGEFVLQELKNAGVNVSHVVRSKCPHTKVNVLIKQEGERAFFYYGGTSLEFSASDVDRSLLPLCRILQVGGTFHLPAFDGQGAAELFQACLLYTSRCV